MFNHLSYCKTIGVFLLAAMSLFCKNSFADPVLNKILTTKSITLAWVDNTRPISWELDNKPTGMAIDLCMDIVHSIETRHNTQLAVKWVKIPTAARFEFISHNQADILCTVAANSAQRDKIVNFSIPWLYTNMNYLAKKSAHIMNKEMLTGHTVGVISGGTAALVMAKMNRDYNYSVSVKLVRDFEEGFSLLEENHISAFITDDVIIRGKLAEMPDKEDYQTGNDGFGNVLEYGLVVPKNAEDLKKLIDEDIKAMFITKRFDKLYDKWFMSPLTAPDDNVQRPMSELLIQEKNSFISSDSNSL
ncbi:transporter substrate-binding domain-containing protein [Buttiauxella gaviniae]|uniref:Transporter substrate-binding domain-containing protein n=1 Tax=Buttiauxella gaviniae TaxID=82990 RepID=A0ABV3NYS6_9ENTR